MQVLLIGIITAYIGVIALIFIGFWFHWTWTGFFHKTLWDGMQLLLVPVVLTLGTFLFILVISRNEQNLAQLRDHTAHDIALDRQREAVLQAYLGRMSEFLLVNHLRLSDPGDEIRALARAQTVTALSRLDTTRKRNLLRFLYESHLINTDVGSRIITLNGVDVRGVDLREVDLSKVDLSGADLSEADLRGANLNRADLREANLSRVNLNGAYLSKVDLRGANLFYANLSGTDLSEAHLGKADLSTAIVTKEQLDKVNPTKKL
jgi:uncharacterized protein YjbI with pentapeptide repeats